MEDQALSDFLGDVRKEAARTLMKLPKHAAFISQFCPAGQPVDAPMPGPRPAPAAAALKLNPAPTVTTVDLVGGGKVFVVDDFLVEPDAVAAQLQAAAALSVAATRGPSTTCGRSSSTAARAVVPSGWRRSGVRGPP